MYLAPEVKEELGGEPAPSSDIYSLGMILWEIISLSPIKASGFMEELRLQLIKGDLRNLPKLEAGASLFSNFRLTFVEKHFPSDILEYRTILVDCWQKIPTERPSILSLCPRVEEAFTTLILGNSPCLKCI